MVGWFINFNPFYIDIFSGLSISLIALHDFYFKKNRTKLNKFIFILGILLFLLGIERVFLKLH